MEIELSKMAAKLKTKRTSVTSMGAKIQAFDIFQTPLSYHYPLPLKGLCYHMYNFFKVHKIKSVLSLHAPVVVKLFGWPVEENIK